MRRCEVYGAQKFAIRVQVDPVAAAARNISLDDIRRVIAKTNSNSPVGTLYGPQQNVTLSATAAMRTADEYRKVIVAYRNGAPVQLDEVADVIDSVENNKKASWFNENRAIMLGVQRQPGSNAVAVVDAVRARLPAYRARCRRRSTWRCSTTVRSRCANSVEDVQVTLGIAIALVVLVIFLFLRSASATLIPTLAVPVSLIGTAAAMYAFGFSINNMTLLALTLSVGFVVDDAIVMLENIVRHIEGGMRPFEAALKGAQEIGFTIISITFSLIAVFIPVLLMGGMVGRIFREFAVTISVAIIISGFVSLTLTPMLCARVLRAHHEGEKQNFVLRAFEAMFSGWLRAYEWTLDKVIRFKARDAGGHLCHAVRHRLALHRHPEGILPERGHRLHFRVDRGAAGHLVQALAEMQRKVAEIIRADKAVDYLNSTVGPGGPTPTANVGRMFIALKPRNERQESAHRRHPAPARAANAVPGWRCISGPCRTSTSAAVHPRANTSTR